MCAAGIYKRTRKQPTSSEELCCRFLEQAHGHMSTIYLDILSQQKERCAKLVRLCLPCLLVLVKQTSSKARQGTCRVWRLYAGTVRTRSADQEHCWRNAFDLAQYLGQFAILGCQPIVLSSQPAGGGG